MDINRVSKPLVFEDQENNVRRRRKKVGDFSGKIWREMKLNQEKISFFPLHFSFAFTKDY